MKDISYLKLLHPLEEKPTRTDLQSDPLYRLKKVILNLIENAILCLNRIVQKESEKPSPSASLMEDYYLLSHYLGFIKRICEDRSDKIP